MTKGPSLSRREFLRLAGLSAGALALAACRQNLPVTPTALPLGTARPITPTYRPPATTAVLPAASNDVTIDLTAIPGTANLMSGAATRVWQYQGQVSQGAASSLQTIPDSYLGPILRLQRGQNLKLRFTNQIPDASIVHWHGLNVPETSDGHPRFAIPQDQAYNYEYRILNRVGTYWYHPHPHGRTGPQAYYGLAGLLIISDDEEAALGLPAGEFDLPLVIQDRSFDSQNQLVYVADTMNGFFGDQVLVNGQAQHTWKVQARPYRFRLLNGSNARIYKLAWDNGTSFTVLATDGGLLEKPVQRSYLTLAPGERVELWADFSAYQPGQEILLRSLPFSVGSGGMMGGMMGSTGLPNGAALDVLKFQVEQAASGPIPTLPNQLSAPGFYTEQDAVNRRNPRLITLAMMMTGTLNGRTFVMDEVAGDEKVRLGDLEIWEFYNAERGMGGMGMMGSSGHPHPMHIHNVQFQVLERQIDLQNRQEYEDISAGFVDDGWKDTVLVWPGERVRVLVRFENYTGLYLYHCHNLEHEDGGMMRNYRVES
jgi:FtsP/CotA-like multicopper oxidase with cupredoxin domain